MTDRFVFKGRRIYLETKAFFYVVENHSNFRARVRPLMQAIDNGSDTGVTSERALAQVLVKPRRDKSTSVVQV